VKLRYLFALTSPLCNESSMSMLLRLPTHQPRGSNFNGCTYNSSTVRYEDGVTSAITKVLGKHVVNSYLEVMKSLILHSWRACLSLHRHDLTIAMESFSPPAPDRHATTRFRSVSEGITHSLLSERHKEEGMT